MIREIKIEDVVLVLSNEGNNIRVKSLSENVILINQTIDVVSEIIKYNLEIVINHFRLKVKEDYGQLVEEDITQLSVSVVLYYLYMYNSWKNLYKKEAKRDLKFIVSDFDNVSTFDII